MIDRRVWAFNIPGLAEQRRVIAIDLPGHGLSAEPTEYSMDTYAAAVASVLDDAGVDWAVCVGQSMGVSVVRQFHRRYPDRCAALVLVDGRLRNDLDPAMIDAIKSSLDRGDPQPVFDLVRSVIESTPDVTEEQFALIDEAVRAQPAEAMKGDFSSLTDDESIWHDDAITAPTLIIDAHSPRMTGEYRAYVKSLVRGRPFEHQIWEGVSHLLMINRPERFNETLLGFVRQFEQPDSSVVWVAHRGGIVDGIPENTLSAFRHAVEAGADAIEIDLRGTRDGHIVIMHDDTVDRTTNGRGQVNGMTLADLRWLDAGGGERIPTLEEVLQLTSGTGVALLLDIKESPVLDKRQVVRLTEQYNAQLNVIVGARTLDDLRAFRALNPNLRTLGFIRGVEDIAPFVEAGVDIIRLWPDWILADPELIEEVHALGKPVWTTAGNAPREELDALIRLGVDGILTDLPESMMSGQQPER
jgi:glycerophosphoryl diester phosphodiesterase